jgi:hypothetical protein
MIEFRYVGCFRRMIKYLVSQESISNIECQIRSHHVLIPDARIYTQSVLIRNNCLPDRLFSSLNSDHSHHVTKQSVRRIIRQWHVVSETGLERIDLLIVSEWKLRFRGGAVGAEQVLRQLRLQRLILNSSPDNPIRCRLSNRGLSKKLNIGPRELSRVRGVVHIIAHVPDAASFAFLRHRRLERCQCKNRIGECRGTSAQTEAIHEPLWHGGSRHRIRTRRIASIGVGIVPDPRCEIPIYFFVLAVGRSRQSNQHDTCNSIERTRTTPHYTRHVNLHPTTLVCDRQPL